MMLHRTALFVCASLALGCVPEVVIGTDRDAVADAPPPDAPSPDAPPLLDVLDAGPIVDMCAIGCPFPPAGCRWTNPIPRECDIRTCGPMICDDGGGPAPDATGPQRCNNNADCPGGTVCEYEPGCDQTEGTCRNDGCRSLPVAPQYCGCDGRTIQQVSACRPDRSYRGMGACPDAGAPDAAAPRPIPCFTRSCDGNTQYCNAEPPGGACAPIPAACLPTPTCACITAAHCTSGRSVCSGDAASGINLGCSS